MERERLVLLVEYVNLFLHSYANIQYLYDVFNIDDESPTVTELMVTLFESSQFDFTTLYIDIDDIDTSSELGQFLYEGLCKNTTVDIDLFEQYICNYSGSFPDTSILSSSKKLHILIKHDKVELNVENLLEWGSTTLDYIFHIKTDFLYQILSSLQPDRLIPVIAHLDEKDNQVACLAGLFSREQLDINVSCQIIIQYMRKYNLEDDSKSIFKKYFIQLLEPLKSHNSDLEKLFTLLINEKGQRTISNHNKELIDLLCEKGILSCEVSTDNNLKIKYS